MPETLGDIQQRPMGGPESQTMQFLRRIHKGADEPTLRAKEKAALAEANGDDRAAALNVATGVARSTIPPAQAAVAAMPPAEQDATLGADMFSGMQKAVEPAATVAESTDPTVDPRGMFNQAASGLRMSFGSTVGRFDGTEPSAENPGQYSVPKQIIQPIGDMPEVLPADREKLEKARKIAQNMRAMTAGQTIIDHVSGRNDADTIRKDADQVEARGQADYDQELSENRTERDTARADQYLSATWAVNTARAAQTLEHNAYDFNRKRGQHDENDLLKQEYADPDNQKSAEAQEAATYLFPAAASLIEGKSAAEIAENQQTYAAMQQKADAEEAQAALKRRQRGAAMGTKQAKEDAQAVVGHLIDKENPGLRESNPEEFQRLVRMGATQPKVVAAAFEQVAGMPQEEGEVVVAGGARLKKGAAKPSPTVIADVAARRSAADELESAVAELKRLDTELKAQGVVSSTGKAIKDKLFGNNQLVADHNAARDRVIEARLTAMGISEESARSAPRKELEQAIPKAGESLMTSSGLKDTTSALDSLQRDTRRGVDRFTDANNFDVPPARTGTARDAISMTDGDSGSVRAPVADAPMRVPKGKVLITHPNGQRKLHTDTTKNRNIARRNNLPIIVGE